MKLSHRITLRISIALLLVMTVWAMGFYFIMVEEINDETDDLLESYSDHIITRALAGESLPAIDNGTNNSYYITEVPPAYAMQHSLIRYSEEMIYLASKEETEPARILKTIFRDSNNKYYELTVSIPTIEKKDLQETILYWIIFLYLALLLVITGINGWVLRQNLKPLYVLLDWIGHFNVEKKIPELNNTTEITEFKKLNEAVLQSAHRSIEAYEQQKIFIGNASHELQTPLAVCLNRLEMLLEDSQLSETQLGEIVKTKQTIQQLIKLNKTLLLLTKIENRQFPDKKELIVNDLIKKLITDYTEIYAFRQITLSVQENAKAMVNMNETLAVVLFGNLLRNAFIHNHTKGAIHIVINASHITISNTGISKPLDPNMIFNRFQGTKHEGSMGLGLALVKSVCHLYEMNIRYDFSEGKHIFSLSL